MRDLTVSMASKWEHCFTRASYCECFPFGKMPLLGGYARSKKRSMT